MFLTHKLKIHFAASHTICRESNTGPSVQVRWYSHRLRVLRFARPPSPVLTGITQVRQTPTPQHMCSSIESSAGTLNSSAILPTALQHRRSGRRRTACVLVCVALQFRQQRLGHQSFFAVAAVLGGHAHVPAERAKFLFAQDVHAPPAADEHDALLRRAPSRTVLPQIPVSLRRLTRRTWPSCATIGKGRHRQRPVGQLTGPSLKPPPSLWPPASRPSKMPDPLGSPTKKGCFVSHVQTECVLVVPTALFHRLGYFQGFSSEVALSARAVGPGTPATGRGTRSRKTPASSSLFPT